jgi:vacuolar-type H+-ATPase subunit F/Vma7
VALPLFIGDEITAAAYRQAGVRTCPVESGRAASAIEEALEDAELLLVTPACAAELGDERLSALVRRARPLLAIVPDAAGRSAPPEMDAAVDRVLGIES